MPATLAGMDTPTNEPTTLRAGDTVAWTRELPEYSAADGWALKYRLLWPTGTAVDIASVGAGATHTVSLTAAQTAAYTPGTATLVAWVEKTAGAERATLGARPVTVLQDLTVAGPYDGRSANQIALANLRAALASLIADESATVISVTGADGRGTTFRSVDELTGLIQHYEREVARETAALALLSGRSTGRVQVRF